MALVESKTIAAVGLAPGSTAGAASPAAPVMSIFGNVLNTGGTYGPVRAPRLVGKASERGMVAYKRKGITYYRKARKSTWGKKFPGGRNRKRQRAYQRRRNRKLRKGTWKRSRKKGRSRRSRRDKRTCRGKFRTKKAYKKCMRRRRRRGARYARKGGWNR